MQYHSKHALSREAPCPFWTPSNEKSFKKPVTKLVSRKVSTAAQAAAPEGQPNLALKAAALKLVNTLASTQHAAVFQAAVMQLPQSAKQRLQVTNSDHRKQGSQNNKLQEALKRHSIPSVAAGLKDPGD